MTHVPPISEVIAPYKRTESGFLRRSSEPDWDALEAALIRREDLIADALRMAGAQFGLFPQIVAQVLLEVGVGRPATAEEAAEIHNQFHLLMQEIRRQQLGE